MKMNKQLFRRQNILKMKTLFFETAVDYMYYIAKNFEYSGFLHRYCVLLAIKNGIPQMHKFIVIKEGKESLQTSTLEMAVLVERKTLKKLLDRVKIAERLVNTLSTELTSIRQSILTFKDQEDEIPADEFSRPFSPDSDNILNEDCCDNVPAKKFKFDFQKEGDYVVAYTDGACTRNGRANAKAGYGVWFGPNHPLNISKPVEGRPTNNTAEIQGCLAAVTTARENGINKLIIRTDSQFTIDCMTKWIRKWRKNNWVLSTGGPVKNKEDLVKLDEQCRSMHDIRWEHVDGHKGVLGNEEADRLANEGAKRYSPS